MAKNLFRNNVPNIQKYHVDVPISKDANLMKILANLGIPLLHLERLLQNKNFSLEFASLVEKHTQAIPDSDSQSDAREMFGADFLGLEEVRKGYGILLPAKQLAKIPFTKQKLKECQGTHVLVAGADVSLNDIRQIASYGFKEPHWYSHESFATTKKVSARWYLIRKEPVPESCQKIYNAQTALLKQDEEVPLACEVAYMVVLYWLTHGERLLSEYYVRCRDKIGARVYVGGFNVIGFDVNYCWSRHRLGNLGLASSVIV